MHLKMITDCCLHSLGVVTQNKMYRGDGGGNNNQYCPGEEGGGNNNQYCPGEEGGIIIRETSK